MVNRNNMSVKEDVVCEKYTKTPFTKVTFKPDLEKFGLSELTDDIVSLMKKRVYDSAGWTKKSRLLFE